MKLAVSRFFGNLHHAMRFGSRVCRNRVKGGMSWLDRALGFPILHFIYRWRIGHRLDLRNPKTFTAKVQWRKVFDRNPLLVTFSDKLAMRKYVARVLGEDRMRQITLPTLGVTDHPTAKWLAGFGTNVAIKANHGSTMNIFILEGSKPDYSALAWQASTWQRLNFGQSRHEWANWKVSKKVLVERLVHLPDGRLADDCKFWVFDGKVHVFALSHDRFGNLTLNFYDRDRNWLEFGYGKIEPDRGFPKPNFYEEMRDIAEQLGQGIDFVRVDYLYGEDCFYLNELTIYPVSGFGAFEPEQTDVTFGALWHLPKR